MRVYRKRTDAAYDNVARFLHWLVVLLIAAQFVIGWTMPNVQRDTQPVGPIAWHLAVGAALVAAMVTRVAWRLTHEPPPHPLPPLIGTLSKATHALLYAALIVVPLLGWANASSRGWTVKLFGTLDLPELTQRGSSVGHLMGDLHAVLAWVLFGLIVMHVGAALFHRFVLKDNILQRML
ncbi:MAG: hypothetical protein QOI13_2525 [Paraburkholderia sp.]|jgi:cytochrome b561|nr:hypothetical protein [Paraburkholderia sp.]